MSTATTTDADRQPPSFSAASTIARDPRAWLVLLPLVYLLALLLGPWVSSPVAIYAGAVSEPSGALLPGYSTIDPNIGQTSYALGKLAVH